jgi:predicted transcriptional regulator
LIEDPNDINVGIALNEKIAGLTFLNTTGKLDFNSGFRSDNPVFLQWCQDLFEYHWSKVGRNVFI